MAGIIINNRLIKVKLSTINIITVVPPILLCPSVDRLPHIPLPPLIFKSRIYFFLVIFKTPFTAAPFSNTAAVSPVPRAALLGGRLYNQYLLLILVKVNGAAVLFIKLFYSVLNYFGSLFNCPTAQKYNNIDEKSTPLLVMLAS